MMNTLEFNTTPGTRPTRILNFTNGSSSTPRSNSLTPIGVSVMPRSKANRRDFLKTTAAVGAAASLAASSYGRVIGANGKIGIAFLGVGGRCQAHIDVINRMAKENLG